MLLDRNKRKTPVSKEFLLVQSLNLEALEVGTILQILKFKIQEVIKIHVFLNREGKIPPGVSLDGTLR